MSKQKALEAVAEKEERARQMAQVREDALNMRRIEVLRQIHVARRYTGVGKFLQMFGRNPLAYMESFCPICRTEYPCETRQVLDAKNGLEFPRRVLQYRQTV